MREKSVLLYTIALYRIATTMKLKRKEINDKIIDVSSDKPISLST